MYQPVNYDGDFTVPSPFALRWLILQCAWVKALESGIYDDPDTPVEDGLIALPAGWELV